MKGYKVFNPDWTCKGFQYEVGKEYTMEEKPSCCNRGFHFCTVLVDCFSYYIFNPNNKVAEIEAFGEIDDREDDSKAATNGIRIVKELTWEEVLRMVNTGIGNSGNRNSGDRNSGNRNSGDRNSGNCNSGDCNSGDCNSGNCNSGDCNSGDRNSGNRNSGDRNSGDCNSGNCNSGNRNSGDRNSGDCNSGNCNSGDYNSGNRNSGNCNSGNCNSGNRNSGNYNSGNYNSGDYNSGDGNTGCFNTKEGQIMMFNKSSGWTLRDWWESNARCYLSEIPGGVVEWIWPDDMTDEEKNAHPEYKTTRGYLKVLDKKENAQNWWDSAPEYKRDAIKSLPNFDADIFEECTGIKI